MLNKIRRHNAERQDAGRISQRRSGLILLVVLGMLSLFSMLAITYVVFSSQSRSSSLTLARKSFRGTPPSRLLDEAAHQILRGSHDRSSVMWRQGLLGDYYGSGSLFGNNDSWISLTARFNDPLLGFRRDNPARLPYVNWLITGPINDGSLEGPKLLDNGMLLKIPLQWNAALPIPHDVWNGRIATFQQGPLQGKSFRIVRYLGEMDSAPASPPPNVIFEQSLQYSITIDLSPALNDIVTVGTTTGTLQDWINLPTPGGIVNGAPLCYDVTTGNYDVPYPILINAAPLNSLGSGVDLDGSFLDPTLPPTAQTANVAATLSIAPVFSFPASSATAPYRDIANVLLQNYSHAAKANTGFQPSGDLDEPYDAPDVSDFHLSHRFQGATSGDLIIPAFHRPAVINFIYSAVVNATGGLAQFNELDLLSTIELMQRASGRPLSFRVTFPNDIVQQNPAFTGSNYGEYAGGIARSPQLDIVFDPTAWSGATAEQRKFEAWVRWLQRGPWDVDTDGDAVGDANWVDLNMPLMTSAEGRLLKIMAAYYVEDLSGRLNLNTSGSFVQALANFNTIAGDNRYASLGPGNQLSQGLGFGTADISLRHLFTNDLAYQRFIGERSGAVLTTPNANLVNFGPASNGNDLSSILRERGRLPGHNQNRLPGLPLSIFGRTGLGIDLFGNPIALDVAYANQIVDDPYEAPVLGPEHSDRLITFPEWERVQRLFDPDRSTLPNRLERLMFAGQTPSAALELVRSTTPRSSSTVAASFPGSYLAPVIDPSSLGPPNPPVINNVPRRITSFSEMVEALAQQRFGTGGMLPRFDRNALNQLFPIEFKHNVPFDINRPFGNGFDDDGDFLVDEAGESAGHGLDDDGMNGIDDPAEIANFPFRHQLSYYTGGFINGILEDYSLGGANFDPFYEAGSAYERFTYGGNQGRQLLARHLYCLAQLILPDNYISPNQPTPTPFAYGTPERARILAQWAVNVVDYRDMDANSTRFAYDVDPLRPKGGNPVPTWEPESTAVPGSGVVWGREQPELLLTETFAFHDLRISRKPMAPPMGNPWQQYRVPQGSLFLEFAATASSDNGSGLLQGVPRGAGNSLYRINGATGRAELALGAITPADENGNQFPVWRVLLTDPQTPVNSVNTAYSNPTTRFNMQYQLANDPSLPVNTTGLAWDITDTETPPTINRAVWFADLAPVFNGPTDNNLAMNGLLPDHVYRNRSGGGVFVAGGQYLTVGPRLETYIGQRQLAAPPPKPEHHPNPHRIEMQANWTQFWTEENDPGLWQSAPPPAPLPAGEALPTPSQFIAPSVSMLALGNAPTGWTTNTEFVGLNISEPNPDIYYPDPVAQLNASNTNADPVTGADGFGNLPADAYVDEDAAPGTNSSISEPSDLGATTLLGEFGWQRFDDGMGEVRPNIETRADWSTAILQRLANPDLPWHATLNPYLTIDWMPIDLTVFSGEATITEDNDVHFTSRQKTGTPLAITEDASALAPASIPQRAGRTLFSYHTEQGPRTGPLGSTIAEPGYFDYRAPLEYIDIGNQADTPVPRLTGGLNVGEFVTLGYLNSRYGLRGMNGENTHANYLNAIVFYEGGAGPAISPTAPMTANRDFINSMELMNVPLSSPGQMLQEFTATNPGTTSPPAHLFDFEMRVGANAGVNPKPAAALLDLLGTRNPWPDSETLLSPSQVVVPAPANNNQVLLNNVMVIYRPPFNRLPSFTEPGKVNMNTASEQNVLRGLMWSAIVPATDRNNLLLPPPYRNEIAASLSPTTPNSALPDPNPRLDASVPSQFAGVFKSSFASSVSLNPNFAFGDSTQSGLLRPQPGGTGMRVFAPAPTAPFNPMTQNYPITRMQNLTASNSNVYAVRVVLGYFEFDPSTGIGREYGEDEGRVQRHKGFYIFDRSIPAAYQEGQDLNTDNCILLRRIIE